MKILCWWKICCIQVDNLLQNALAVYPIGIQMSRKNIELCTSCQEVHNSMVQR